MTSLPRVHARTSPLAFVGRLLVVLLALLLLYAGVVILALSLGLAPKAVNGFTGYRAAYEFVDGLGPEDATGLTRAIAAGVGLLLLLVCGYLAYKELPRPYLGRHDHELETGAQGRTRVQPGVIESLAEAAAVEGDGVNAARARFDDEQVLVDATARRATGIPEALRDARERVRSALAEHDLPAYPVTVRLGGFDRKHKRELN